LLRIWLRARALNFNENLIANKELDQ
jgi:hypothetical protein